MNVGGAQALVQYRADRLLDLARIESGTVELHTEEASVASLVADLRGIAEGTTEELK